MKTNKEVIDSLVQYFKEHADFDTIARALANQMIDMHRVVYAHSLLEKERECLEMRMLENSDILKEFVKNGGSQTKFWLKNMPSEE